MEINLSLRLQSHALSTFHTGCYDGPPIYHLKSAPFSSKAGGLMESCTVCILVGAIRYKGILGDHCEAISSESGNSKKIAVEIAYSMLMW